MHRKDLDAILETVDVLRRVTRQVWRGVRELAWYLFVFGLYPALNIAADWFGLGMYWVTTLFPATWQVTHPPLAVVLVILAGVVLGQIIVYGYAIHRSRYRPGRPVRLSILPKIGWDWGLLMGGLDLAWYGFYLHRRENQAGVPAPETCA